MNRIDRKTLLLLITPLAALLACLAVNMLIPAEKKYVPEEHAFLSYVNELRLSSKAVSDTFEDVPIRDVFLRDNLESQPIAVTMIVTAPAAPYAVINGRSLQPGVKTDRFTLSSITEDSVTLVFADGSKETFHVEMY